MDHQYKALTESSVGANDGREMAESPHRKHRGFFFVFSDWYVLTFYLMSGLSTPFWAFCPPVVAMDDMPTDHSIFMVLLFVE